MHRCDSHGMPVLRVLPNLGNHTCVSMCSCILKYPIHNMVQCNRCAHYSSATCRSHGPGMPSLAASPILSTCWTCAQFLSRVLSTSIPRLVADILGICTSQVMHHTSQYTDLMAEVSSLKRGDKCCTERALCASQRKKSEASPCLSIAPVLLTP